MRSRPFAPLPGDHPLIREGQTCAGCKQRFAVDDVTTLVGIGPGDDEAERARARAGGPYTCVSVPAHWACVTGSDDPVADWEADQERVAAEREELRAAAEGGP